MYFVDVILPLNRTDLVTYSVPEILQDGIEVGTLLEVPYGAKKVYTAVVTNIHQQTPSYKVKEVLAIQSPEPAVFDKNIQFWRWMANYYLAPIGDVMKTALPKSMLVSSEAIIQLHPEFKDYHQIYEIAHLSNRKMLERVELILKQLMVKHRLLLTEVREMIQVKNVYPIINFMVEHQFVEMVQEVEEGYSARIEKYVQYSRQYSEEELKVLFDQLSRAPKQLEILMAFTQLSRKGDVKQKDLLEMAKATLPALKSMVRKDIFFVESRAISRIGLNNAETEEVVLSEEQTEALNEINTSFETQNVCLFQGVTAAGKTHVYIELMKQYMEQEGQILFLLPEIALTTQIIKRLELYFGEEIGIYHSKFNQNERFEIWKKVRDKEYKIIVGPRSAMFLPFEDLSLIIVDEEHDFSYKQFDPSPRYNGRDCAVYFSHLFDAKVVLGTATPSVDTIYNTKAGKYGHVKLMKRHTGGVPPELQLVDLKADLTKGESRPILSKHLKEQMKLALSNQKQIILFQNRRGYVPILECNDCGWTPMCDNCDITLTYYKSKNELHCHYCGSETQQPMVCTSCGSTDLTIRGFGTEKVEEELAIFFPEVKVARMDLDTTRNKGGHQQIISAFESGKVDILVGTQMVSKGLDFKNVAIVGVLSADSVLFHTDYRSNERAFSLLTQIAGRAGRSEDRGKVIIQTLDPENELLHMVLKQEFDRYMKFELKQRETFKYPPFVRMVRIQLKHENYISVEKGANELAKMLKVTFGNKVLGPEYPPISRIRNRYINEIIIKLGRNSQLNHSKLKIQQLVNEFYKNTSVKNIRVAIDVDPIA